MLHGQTRYNLKSRFLDELPETALKWITPRKQTHGFEFGAFARDYPRPTVAPLAQRNNGSEQGLRVGVKVFHAKFGEGTVLALEGSGDDARAQINFPRHGVKWLALSVAKLSLIP
jgi:DNA helicase-2/ATP-dependent DNA helicase PcrA